MDETQTKSCPKCGFKRNPDAVECPRCGIIFEKYEQIQRRKDKELKNEEAPPASHDIEPFHVFQEPQAIPHLNCNACGSKKTLAPTRIYKFGGIIRFIGYLIVIPSICGVFFAGILILIAFAGVASSGSAAIMGLGLAVFVAAGSLISGLIGWLLIMKKKVFKCTSCGFILDRD